MRANEARQYNKSVNRTTKEAPGPEGKDPTEEQSGRRGSETHSDRRPNLAARGGGIAQTGGARRPKAQRDTVPGIPSGPSEHPKEGQPHSSTETAKTQPARHKHEKQTTTQIRRPEKQKKNKPGRAHHKQREERLQTWATRVGPGVQARCTWDRKRRAEGRAATRDPETAGLRKKNATAPEYHAWSERVA